MAYQDEEQVGMRWRRSQQAIALAMEGRWREAVVANQELIEDFPNDVNAYNRLGRAYMELGEYAKADEAYRQALELDPCNMIAKKNLGRLARLSKTAVGFPDEADKVEPQQFVEETGKAGLVNLYRLGSPEVLARMMAGDKIRLRIDRSALIAENTRGEYLGRVEPKHEQRLIKLIEGGNQYFAAIVSCTDWKVTLIIREIYQDPSQAGRPSFPAKELKGPRPYISDKVRRELEGYEEAEEEPGYTIVGGSELELSPDDSAKLDDTDHDEEETEEE